MAIDTTWSVSVGTVAAPTDFTSRVLSMSIRQSVDVNVIGRGQCVITLLNKDGALTPGGGGTYSSVDWFAQGVFVDVATDTGGSATSTDVFDGVIVDFDLEDDGVFSTVTITAIDWLSIGGKSPGPTTSPFSSSYAVATQAMITHNSFAGVTLYLPLLGEASFVTNGVAVGGNNNFTVKTDVTMSWPTLADVWQQSLIPSGNDVLWATTITRPVLPTVFSYNTCASTNSRDTGTILTFEFDPSGSVTGSKLPFDIDRFSQAFNNDTLITQATIDANYTGSTSVTASNSNLTVYGNRTVAYTDTFLENSTATSNMANLLVNRYGTSEFTPVSLQLSASMVRSQCADAAQTKWRKLLGIDTGLWQKAKITWTGSGASSQTEFCMVRGRTINVTPSDTIITLDLINWYDNHGFILDEDELDYGRLG